VLAAAVGGCTSGSPLPAADLARLTAEPQVVLAHQPPRLPLTVFTKETTEAERIGGAFGPIGLAAGASRSMADAKRLGARLVGGYGLTDPVEIVEARFIAVAATRGLGTMRAVPEPVPSASGPDLKVRFGDSTVLVFKTVAWLVAYGKDEHRHSALYRAEASLLRGGVQVWRAECPGHGPGFDDPATQSTLVELTVNDAALLRARFAEKATACADFLLGLFFGDLH
jgi:hypothetical protein